MFNIKSIVKQITERGRETSVESPASSYDDSLAQKTEGFLCPKCMKQLPSAWELQSHYESVHEEEKASVDAAAERPALGVLGSAPSPLDADADDRAIDQDDVSVYSDVVNSSLTVEDVPRLTDVQELQELLRQTLARKATLESRVMCLVQTNVTLKAASEEMNRESFQLRERLKILEAQVAHRESIDDAAVLRQELVQVQRVMDEMNREREKERDDLQAQLMKLQEKETDVIIANLKDSLQIKEKECLELAERLEHLQLKYNQLDENYMLLSEQHDEESKAFRQSSELRVSSEDELCERIETKTLAESPGKELLEMQLSEKQEECVKISSEVVKLKQNLVSKSNLLENIEKQKKELQDLLDKEKGRSRNLSNLMENLEKEQKELEELFDKEKEKSQNLSNSLQNVEKQVKALEDLLENEKGTVNNLNNLLENAHQELKKLQDLLEEEKGKNEDLSSLLENIEQQERKSKDLLEMEKGKNKDLSAQLNKQEESLQRLMSERAALCEQLEEKVRDAETAALAMETLKGELEEKAKNLKVLEENALSQTKKSHLLQNELKLLNESSNAAIQVKNEEIKTLEAHLDEVAGEKLALEAQLEATEVEQQKLLERCYASTNEIESLHHSKAELRRKWEECVSALQELGRENATLQLDIDKLLARKWAEDADVTHCTLCHREFTMLLRKHHCRNCGQIFCNECSSKTAAVVSNKKPVRVCDSCFAELRTQ